MNAELRALSITTGNRPLMFSKPGRNASLRSAARAWLRVPVFSAAFVLTTLYAYADEPKVTAVLTSSETVLGRPVELQIKITGSPGAKPPDVIAVDGLDIRYSGQSQMIEGRNLQFSYSFVYSYTIMPERTGTFRIPPQKIQAGSNSLRTPELTLNVADSTARRPDSARGGERIDERRLVFAEIVIPKNSVYVGEIVPAEIRLCFNGQARANLTDWPQISGQGFTAQKLTKPQESLENIGGQSYNVLTFKTAVAAARTGPLEIGPVKAKAVIAVPRRSSGRGRSPFDIFNMDDPFADPFFANPFGGLTEKREIDIESKPATLEVKPLPKNAPADFSGAVGVFTMEIDAKPKSVQVGDPITVTARISGRGNFAQMTAPSLEDERGWHKYPPSSAFKQDDDVGISGEKTFETVLTPNEQKTNVPRLIFSYFDPLKEKYVSLHSDALSVRIEGGAVAAKPAATATPSVAPSATSKSAAKAEDILYQITDWPGTIESFAPIYTRANFWFTQIIPLVALFGFAGWKWRENKLSDREAQRRADLEHEAAQLQRKLRRSHAPPQEYYAEAARAVQIKTALAKNVNPNTVDANTAASAFQLDEASRGQLQSLFQRKDELRYSGGENGESALSSEQQREVFELIESLRI